ncbi:site-specific DNA-methyltransferase [Candidatus Parcubacteria bacterium]|nr:site-specific DNA-methyltransferase [Candidatus Parcubacteria bacterium]
MENNTHRKKDSARLFWDSKPKRAANPKDIEFQTAEVVIPNPEKAGQLPMSFCDNLIGEDDIDKQKMNRLIWGDNLLAMQALLAQGYEGKINLIYIDPPFDSKADYSHKIKLGETELTKEPSVIERLAYKDTWAGGTDSYLDMLYPRLQLMKRLLAPDGSIYVHLDWHVGHYVKVMMDEVFGRDNFLNEIVWEYQGAWSETDRYFPRRHNAIYLYARNQEKYFFDRTHEDDINAGTNFNRWYEFVENNRIYARHAPYHDTRFKTYVDNFKKEHGREAQGDDIIIDFRGSVVGSVWYIKVVDPKSPENVGFGTQKPLQLLERIIESSCPKDGLVADFFGGSSTALVAAENLNRRWIGCELGKVGIQVARGRLVEQESKPFLIENIGNYQREMIYLGGGRIYEMQKIILKLYGAEPMANRKDLGVRKDESENLELVYCGYPDRPVAAHKVEDLATEAQTLDGAGYKRLVILAWDYEYNYDELLQTRLKAAGKDIKTEIISRQIPPDIYEYLKKARDEEEIEKLAEKVKFFEKPYLKVRKPEVKGNVVIVGIDNYVLYGFPLGSGKKADESREELIHLVKDNFAILIDYWAIDWDYDGLVFKSQWQDFRGNGRKAKIVTTKKEHTYEKNGKHKIAMRVVDIFGNDATAIIDINI